MRGRSENVRFNSIQGKLFICNSKTIRMLIIIRLHGYTLFSHTREVSVLRISIHARTGVRPAQLRFDNVSHVSRNSCHSGQKALPFLIRCFFDSGAHLTRPLLSDRFHSLLPLSKFGYTVVYRDRGPPVITVYLFSETTCKMSLYIFA